MIKFIFGAVVLATAAVAAPASAADLALKAPVAPPFTWAGIYVGAGVGGIWANDRIHDVDVLNTGATYTLKDSAVIASSTVGYNFQAGQFVYGIEANAGATQFNKTVPDPGAFIGPHGPMDSNALRGGPYGDITGRFGFAVDRSLFYAKGGFAFWDGTANVDNTNDGGGIANAKEFMGWTIGGGLEYAFAPHWSAKVEYLHFDFGTQTATLTNFGNFRYTHDLTADSVTVGINFHFGH
jgi:outer membrane immunogenic protein